jgi:NMT1-like family
MPQAIRNTLFSARDLLLTFGPYALVVLLMLGFIFWKMDPFPPKHLVMATGPEGSDYAQFGQQYAEFFKSHGITLELKKTEGSRENLLLLREGKVDLGFTQGGSGKIRAKDDKDLASVGSLFYEPIWVFYRADRVNKLELPKNSSEPTRLSQLSKFKINVDTEGSGVPRLMQQLFEANHIDLKKMNPSNLDDIPASKALISGALDAMILVQSRESKAVQTLLTTPGIKLMNFSQGSAYDNMFPFLSSVTLNRGIVDLGKDLPAEDVNLLAPTTSLITRNTTHPSALLLLSMAADKFHSNETWFSKSNAFPSDAQSELPITSEAERYMKNGAPYLQRHLPFWAANLIERMWIVLSLSLVVLFPLSKAIPPLYQYRIRSRILKSYGILKLIEDKEEALAPQDTAGRQQLVSELNELEANVEKITVPVAYANELYSLRHDIQLVHEKLRKV